MRNDAATKMAAMARDGESSADRDLAAESRTFSRRSLHGLVAHQIGRQIIQGELQPGQLLPNEAAWSARMRVSRTAMREAIKVLAAKGLIESRPKTGTRVRPREFWNFLDPDLLSWQLSAGPIERHIKDLFELRRLVEPAAAEIAARRIDDGDIARLEGAYRGMEAAGDDGTLWVEPDLQFHRAILKATRNELIHSLGAMIESVLAITFHLSSANPRGQRHALPLHSAILDALRRRAPTAARRAMNRLLDKSEKDVRRAVTALRRHGVELAADGRSRKRQWTGGR